MLTVVFSKKKIVAFKLFLSILIKINNHYFFSVKNSIVTSRYISNFRSLGKRSCVVFSSDGVLPLLDFYILSSYLKPLV